MRIFERFAAAAAATLIAAGASAATMTLEEARKAALERSRAVARAEIAVRQAQLDEQAAAWNLGPSLSASASWSASVKDGAPALGDPSLGLSASQTLFSGGSVTAALKIARLQTAEAEDSLRAARIAVLKEIDARFLDVLEKKRTYGAAAVAREAAEKQLDIARAKKEAGKLAEADYLQSQSTWATKRTSETQARWAVETSMKSLASYLGRAAEPAELDEAVYSSLASSVVAAAGKDLDSFAAALYAKGRRADPDLAKLDAAEASAALSTKTKAAAFFPTVSVSASLAAAADDGSVSSGTPSLKLSASIPIFPIGGRTAAYDSAKLAERSARSETEDAEEALKLSCYSTTLEVLSASDQIQAAAAALAYAQANYDLAVEKFRLGTGTSSAVVDAEATLATARSGDISARFDLYAAIASLARLIGAEDERGLADALD